MQNYKDKETLKTLYEKHKNVRKVAELLNVNHKTISAWMKKHEIETLGSQGARTNNLNHDFFESIDSEQKAYWLGFIMADGCVYKGSDKYSLRLQINLKGSDVHHLEKFQKAINSSYKIQEKIVKTSNVCLLKVNSTKMCQDLMSLNVTPRKSLVSLMPDIPSELMKHYIRGYFDGDGCLDIAKGNLRARIAGGSEMLRSIQESLTEASIFSALYLPTGNKKISNLEITRKDDALKFAEWIYKDSKEFLERKKDIYQTFELCPL